MRRISTAMAGCLCATAGALADTSIDRAFEPSPRDCSDDSWPQNTLDAIPSIAHACQAVEQRNGNYYVKLSGKVQKIASDGGRLIVDFEDVGELAFTPSANTRLYLDGQRTEFAELRPGTDLNFYLPEDRLQAELQPEINRAFVVVFPPT
jgi:hypothetical protein